MALISPRDLYLRQHPELAKIVASGDRARLTQFLTNHGGIATGWQRVRLATQPTLQDPNSPAPAATPAPNPAGASGGGGLTGEQASAKAIIVGALEQYGLGSLAEWAWSQYLNGVPTSQIMLDFRSRPEYAARFPGMAALAKRGQAISEQEYIGLESQYRSIARSYGIPESFYDSADDFGRHIANGKSPQEFAASLDRAEQVGANDERGRMLRQRLAEFYQVRGLEAPANIQGIVTAWFIDPEKAEAIADRQFRALQAGVAADRAGFAGLTRTEAEDIAGYDVTEDQATQTFGQLTEMTELTADLPGQGESGVDRADLIAAGFKGDATAQRRIERTRSRRKADFATRGGGYAASQQGVTGLRSAT